MQVKIWFQNRRNKWKRGQQQTPPDAAAHAHLLAPPRAPAVAAHNSAAAPAAAGEESEDSAAWTGGGRRYRDLLLPAVPLADDGVSAEDKHSRRRSSPRRDAGHAVTVWSPCTTRQCPVSPPVVTLSRVYRSLSPIICPLTSLSAASLPAFSVSRLQQM